MVKKVELNKKRDNVRLKHLTVLGGYDVYIPFLEDIKEDSPIWVDKGNNLYDVLIIENGDTWGAETLQYIDSNLPLVTEPICRLLSPNDLSIDERDKCSIDTSLNAQIFDKNGNILSIIQTFNRELPTSIKEKIDDEDWEICPTKEIVVKHVVDKNSIKDLMAYLLKQKWIHKYGGIVLWHNSSNSVDYSIELGFTPTEYGFSYFMIPQKKPNTR